MTLDTTPTGVLTYLYDLPDGENFMAFVPKDTGPFTDEWDETYYVPKRMEKPKAHVKVKYVPDVDNVVALTGHRPEKIRSEVFIRGIIRQVLDTRNVGALITGMAAGVDLWGADEAIELGIPVVAARPWSHHQPRKEDKDLYNRVWDAATMKWDIVKTTATKDNPKPYPGAYVYQKRNEFMVDNAHKVLAVWDGSEGGTKNCFDYAREKEKKILRYDISRAAFVLYDEEGNEYVQE